ncbi:Potassium channel protein [Beijerinckiaceae bacterium RH AL1]|nr:NAD-binding protein [Beijerinckiaceae bacterium]VVB45630.1 Potassium channel protein [Beijerinckiaceae bacterium RH CH11]VVB45705.1 Potassium channel protein [Beijerinckiaceae bacterium RH AL8]VVC54961.1 Potassium channel protein [Beijerinckiaceae bacterium RH AL1]
MNAFASPIRNLIGGTLFMLVVMATATLAYRLYGWSLGDALYMVVLTVYTVGYDEVRPIDTAALRAITIALIVTGCTGMIFLTGSLIQLITVSQLQAFLGVRRMQRDIDQLAGHVIICGYGRIGQSLGQDLEAAGIGVIVLDRSEARVESARGHGFLAMLGDATDEATLRKAGIMRARALTTVLPDDAANVFITLSARSLNKNLDIIARGEIPSTESKLIQAGADRVVLPAHIGAERIAELLLFKDMTGLREGSKLSTIGKELARLGLDLEIVAAARGSAADGATVGEIESRAAGAFMIAAIEQKGEKTVFQPPLGLRIAAGDGVAVVGRPTRVGAMQAIFAAAPKPSDPAQSA